MIQLKTLVNCIDNSGAAIVECVNVLRSKRPAKVGMSRPLRQISGHWPSTVVNTLQATA
jgi:ribosomal protein L14